MNPPATMAVAEGAARSVALAEPQIGLASPSASGSRRGLVSSLVPVILFLGLVLASLLLALVVDGLLLGLVLSSLLLGLLLITGCGPP